MPLAPAPLVVIAASAGGLHSLGEVLGALPAEFPAPILVVQHLDPHHRSFLASILGRRTCLPVAQAYEGARALPGTVWIAPPDAHLMVRAGNRLTLGHGERVRFSRPSADVLFESAAQACAGELVAVVLSGSGSDGARGVRAVKTMGGKVIVEDPASAESRGMPAAAIGAVPPDAVLPVNRIAAALCTVLGAGAA